MRLWRLSRMYDARRLTAVGASALLFCLATRLHAQGTVTIDSGMTRDSVIKRLGQPLSVRTFGSHTYLMYANGCEKNCGMNDLVTLDSGKVVDAIFRARGRQYTGKSSSPRMIPAVLARGAMPADSSGSPRHIVVPPAAVPAAPARKPASVAKPEPPKNKADTTKKVAPAKKPD